MDLKSQKRLAARILNCGISRIRIDSSKEVEEALTREDIRKLIRKGLIRKIPKKGQARTNAKKKLLQKKKGRRKGTGSRKGKYGARNPAKKAWIKKIRPMRRLLKELRDSDRIKKDSYRSLYLKIKGNMFRNKKHLLYYLEENGLLLRTESKITKVGKAKTKMVKGLELNEKAKETQNATQEKKGRED